MAIHGNKSQSARTRALAAFKAGEIPVLVATDIAARGLDIEQLPQVVNFELPNVPEDYVHRIGRTGRAGSPGAAVSLVEREELKLLAEIERLIRRPIARAEPQGFIPPPPGTAVEPERAPFQRHGAAPSKRPTSASTRGRAGAPQKPGSGSARPPAGPQGKRQGPGPRARRPSSARQAV
jgi:ATP-dependent RNA helicase RhlE